MNSCLTGIALLSLVAADVSPAQSKKATPPAGDVFSSGGAPDDRRKYVSRDGRNFDRCAYDTDHMADLPDTKLYGMPDHVPVDSAIMRQYARCAVDACAAKGGAVCWGRKDRQKPVMPRGPDAFNTNGFSNCQGSGTSVTCDPPKMLPLLPAFCLADTTLICEAKVVYKLYAKVNTVPMRGYYDNYGKVMPPSSGDTYYSNTHIFVDTPPNMLIGDGLAGPVSVRSEPARYSWAQGEFDALDPDYFVISQLKDLNGRQVLGEGETIRLRMTKKSSAPAPRPRQSNKE